MITMKKEMIRGLRRTASSNARSVVERNDTSTNKVVFSWDSIAKESPNKDRDLKQNLSLP